jgi:hypothetical protein
MEEMSDTPRTDEEEGCRGIDDSWIKMVNGGDTTADFARELERENNALREEIRRLKEENAELKNPRYLDLVDEASA